MRKIKTKISHYFSVELGTQLLLTLAFFWVVIYYRDEPRLQVYDILFFATYLSSALTISYWLLPSFFYTKRYVIFFTGVLLILALVLAVEQFILKEVFCPNKSDRSFWSAFYFLLAEIVPVLMMFTAIKLAFDTHKKEVLLEKLKSTAAENELQFLKSQINPHFLFNNLNNLYAYALESSPKTPAIILKLSSLLRYMLYDCREKLVALDKEIDYLNDFIRLQELQIENRGTVEFTVNGKPEGKFIAPLILIVFIENCFTHSTSGQTEGIYIRIDLRITENRLLLYCCNTFSPNKNTIRLSKGIGLENVRNRLELLYPNAYTLRSSISNQMYTTRLELNLNTRL